MGERTPGAAASVSASDAATRMTSKPSASRERHGISDAVSDPHRVAERFEIIRKLPAARALMREDQNCKACRRRRGLH